jgi:REP element-mobilizing transposase RayT
MPRANRHFLPGSVWHITHRCHRKSFLLKFALDRQSYLRWLFEAKKRFGLCVLNYMVTSNHVHLLVKDTGGDVIAQSMQLIAGRTAQEYNQRKNLHGAFWEDRYHATAIEADEHLHRCVVYIDLNMVRAGIVTHPLHWVHSGYREIQRPPKRYAIIDLRELTTLCGFADSGDFQSEHRQWVEQTLERERTTVMIAGRKPLPSAVWHLSRESRMSLAPKRCTAQLSRKTESMLCVSRVKLTTMISAAKMAR